MQKWRRTLILGALALVCSVGMHNAHRFVDQVRRNAAIDVKYTVLPAPEVLRVASLGYHTTVADLVWIQAVLQFVDVVESGGERGLRWLRAMIDIVMDLDPHWRTTYFYGGSMLRVLDDIDGSDRVFQAGMTALPDDHHFPFSLAMNALLYRGDHKAASEFMLKASEVPSAPSWYRTAVGGFLHKSGQRRTAMRYLKEQLDHASTERERELLVNKYKTLLHEEIAASLEGKRKAWEETHGQPLTDLAAMGALPPDPYGAGWMISIDGAIRSQTVDDLVASRERLDERSMLTNRWLLAK